ncbi:alpha/beta hydrolase family protein [Hyphobacterium sp.]|uniref:alpha/beta hydrolase family protein n=1 Tax=Hyphobacterium sp. TaxID=2004662 RepID=UPI003B522EB3
MPGKFVNRVFALAVGALLAACRGDVEELDPLVTCHAGAYRTPGGVVIDISPLSTDALRWRASDGTTGTLRQQPDGDWSGNVGWTETPHPAEFRLGACDDGTIEIANHPDLEGNAGKLSLPAIETELESDGVTLAGRLVLPLGEGPFPLVVLVHGSEDYSARDFYPLQRLLPALGMAAFVYDKRGTGGSSGEYTQDFHLLAADAAAALAEARRLAGDQIASAGYLGASQGGWVAPLAASMSDADFVIATFGLAEGPLAEDRDEVLFSMVEAGYGDDPEAMAGARALADGAGRLLASGWTEGQAEMAALKDRYRDEPWYDEIEGEFTHEFLARPIWQLRSAWPFFDQGTSWDYDPRPVLERLEMPVLWVLAGNDAEAPSQETQRIVAELQAQDLPIDLAVYPTADHGIIEFEMNAEGERESIRYSEGYFRLLSDWARDREFRSEYGNARLFPRTVTAPADE